MTDEELIEINNKIRELNKTESIKTKEKLIQRRRELMGIHVLCINCKEGCTMTVSCWMWSGWSHDIGGSYGRNKCYCGCEKPKPKPEIAKRLEKTQTEALEAYKKLGNLGNIGVEK